MKVFWRDLRRDLTLNRGRRLGQAFVMAREMPAEVRHVHVHYLHTPASVVRYAALLTDRRWTFSAHAKDIWTTPDWEKREKLAEAKWGVTCTAEGAAHLDGFSPSPTHVSLLYHGLDLSRFPPPPLSHPVRDGADPADPIRIVSVGRAVAKKGFDDLLRALATLPEDLNWRFAHVGGGELLGALKDHAKKLGIASRCAFLGGKDQPHVVALLREADLFVLPSKAAASGDRDGLPNVLMEAASQRLAIVASDFAGIPEFVRNGVEGELVRPAIGKPCRMPSTFSPAIRHAVRNSARRHSSGCKTRFRWMARSTNSSAASAPSSMNPQRPRCREGNPGRLLRAAEASRSPLPVGRPDDGAPDPECPGAGRL